MSLTSAKTGRRTGTVASALALSLALLGGRLRIRGSTTAAPDTQVDTTEGAADRAAAEETELFPDVLEVDIAPLGGERYEVAVTLSSPYDSPERYADAWRALDEEGNELGRRELLHDHASEQPFTRQTTVEIPEDVEEITVEGRDQVSGYGGATVTVAVPRIGS